MSPYLTHCMNKRHNHKRVRAVAIVAISYAVVWGIFAVVNHDTFALWCNAGAASMWCYIGWCETNTINLMAEIKKRTRRLEEFR